MNESKIINITLNHLEDFFQTPSLDLSTPVSETEIIQQSGVEYLFKNHYENIESFDRVIVRVQDNPSPEKRNRFQKSLELYYKNRIHQLNTDTKIISKKSLRMLSRGILIAACIFAISIIISQLVVNQPANAISITAENFVSVLVTVILWFPIEQFLYGKLDQEREIKFIERMRKIPVEVV